MYTYNDLASLINRFSLGLAFQLLTGRTIRTVGHAYLEKATLSGTPMPHSAGISIQSVSRKLVYLAPEMHRIRRP